MKIVLDTNVILPAFAGRGFCNDLYEICLQRTELITSETQISELRRVLAKKLKVPEAHARQFEDTIRDQFRIVEPVVLNNEICRDPDDTMILATAKAGNAQFIVTGDEDLLVLRKFENTLILSPRDFWKMLTGINKSK